MNKGENKYQSIISAIFILGGVQIVSIIVSIIRNKLSAVWLGTTGFGIYALYTSAVLLLTQLSNIGISTASIKSISISSQSKNGLKLAKTLFVADRLALYTAIFGFFIAISTSYFFSYLNFNNGSSILSFMILSIAVFFTQLSSGKNVQLQGMRYTKEFAKSTTFGAVFSSLATIAFFYFFREQGIIISIIIASVITYIVAFYYTKTLNLTKFQIHQKLFRIHANPIIRTGLTLSIAAIATQAYVYALRVLVTRFGGIEEVGLFSAGSAIITSYFGMVFTALGTDYFPRLSKIAQDQVASFNEVNKQAEITLLLLTPLLVAFIAFMKFGIILLYSAEFLPMLKMLRWSTIGVFFQAISWTLAFLVLAKGQNNFYVKNEIIAILYLLTFHIIGYVIWGLQGLGIGFFTSYLLYSVQMILVTYKIYKFRFSADFLKIVSFCFTLLICSFVINTFVPTHYQLFCNLIIIFLSALFSISKLIAKLQTN